MRLMILLCLLFISWSGMAGVKNYCASDEVTLTTAARDSNTVYSLCFQETTEQVIYRYVKDDEVVKVVNHTLDDLKYVNEKMPAGQLTGYHLKTKTNDLFWVLLKDHKSVISREFQYWKGGQLMAAEEIDKSLFTLVKHNAVSVEKLKH